MPKRIQRPRITDYDAEGNSSTDLWRRRTHSNPPPSSSAPLRDPKQSEIERDDGLTPEEGRVMDHLAAAASFFQDLRQQHPCDRDEFVAGIHRLQDLLAVRIARRHYPEGWRNDADPA